MRLLVVSTFVNATGRLPDMTSSTVARPGAPPVLTDVIGGCGNPVPDGVLEPAAAETLAQVVKALADPTRVRLLSLIADSLRLLAHSRPGVDERERR